MARRLVCNYEHTVEEDDEFELHETAPIGRTVYWCPLVREWMLERCDGPTCDTCREYLKERA
jgi:hypothetical protein